jgi:hypothetical protein
MDHPSSSFAETVILMIAAILLALIVVTVRAVWMDARHRGKPSILVVLLCLLSFPLGLVVWLNFRPEPLPDAGRQLSLTLA